MDTNLQQAREELDKEFRQLRDHLSKIHDSVAKVDKAGPEDDVTKLLEDLEDVVKKVRTGGLIGGGSKGHRKAREQYFELQGR